MLLLTFSSLNILQQVEELLALQLLQLTPQDLQLNAVLQVKIVEVSSVIISLQKCSGQTQSVCRELRILGFLLGKSALQLLDFSLTFLNLLSRILDSLLLLLLTFFEIFYLALLTLYLGIFPLQILRE